MIKNHVVYNWNIKKAKIITTMPEHYFKDTIDIINKYIPYGKEIVMLSKYDIFVPLLVNKYYPYNNFAISPFLFSDKIVNKIIDDINKNKPKYIFVDNSFILGDFSDPYEILYDNLFNYRERKSRELRYKLIKNIFDKVKDNYVFVESGKLVSVYILKNK